MNQSKNILIYFAYSILVFCKPTSRQTENKIEKKKENKGRKDKEEMHKTKSSTNKKSILSQRDPQINCRRKSKLI